jgi:hypothetical protein
LSRAQRILQAGYPDAFTKSVVPPLGEKRDLIPQIA